MKSSNLQTPAPRFNFPVIDLKLNKTTIARCEPALSVLDCVSREMTEKDGSNLLAILPVNHSKSNDGKNLNIPLKHLPKAERFWMAKKILRSDPANCGRCGQPNGNGFRQCDRCRDALKKYKARKLVEREEYDPSKAMAMIHQMRREVTKLREMFKASQRWNRKNYARGYNAGKKHGVVLAKYADAYPEISKQELAQINHAYEE